MKIKKSKKFRTAKFYRQYEKRDRAEFEIMYPPKQCLSVITWLLWCQFHWTNLNCSDYSTVFQFVHNLEGEQNECTIPILQEVNFRIQYFPLGFHLS